MSNYDELFTASTEKNESKQERPFNKEEWVAKKQQERAEAFEMLDAATTEAVSNPEAFRDYSRRTPDERQVLKALISSSPCDIRMTNELDGNVCARYVPKDNAIYIRQGLDGYDIFRSLSQEIVIANFAKNGVAREDCVFTAYCATYVLCERNGFNTGDFDFEKVPEMFKDTEPKAIRGQLDKIRDSANELSQDMNRIMEEQQKAKRSRDDGAR